MKWVCYACETENEAINPPDGDTDDECQMCGMQRPHSDAETRAAALQAEVERLRGVLIKAQLRVDHDETMCEPCKDVAIGAINQALKGGK